MALMPEMVGSGRGWQRMRHANNATIGRNDTKLASHGLVSALRNAPFIGGPQACNAPPIKMMG
jgi:hypothetical protein